ncbi:hypothetical protein [Flavobacterium sedimenticola]|uniref:Peptidase M56 domain-containing protein n=1 Tax=Flavobacterium sedimenticola TaxID=3043286 RepID=A0ABT6XR98_9FLAO|nr:hypothetical protein [Flavobacterium sedimenticola]MDI9257512.1 hypothetical protein [Flavobacterium sedimenticola]
MIVVVFKYLVPKGYRGLTIFPLVILKARNSKADAILLQHERIHLRQQLELLVLPFFIWYAIEFLLRWMVLRNRHQAYREISFEREAYANEKDLHYLQQRSIWNFLNYF